MPRTSVAKLGLLFTAIVAGGFGCELIAKVDRSQIGDSGGGGGAQATSSTSSTSATTGSTGGAGGTGGTGGTGGVGGVGGTGGTGGGTSCTTAVECPAPANECVDATCDQGKCGQAPKPAGTLGATQTAGDCLKSQCDGAGKLGTVVDDGDLPVDGVECTDDVCTAGVASNPPKAASVACGLNGALFCDGAGKCVGCNTPSDCAGQDTECQARTCTAGVCGLANTAKGTAVTAQTAANCKKDQCDGNGAIESVADDTDLPVDNETCTSDVCTAGVPSNPPVAVGATCAEGSGILCDGAGSCAACLVATDCAGVDTECQQRSCTAGVCGVTNTAAGTALAAQTSSDCKKAVCDGNGATTTQNDDTDLPDDNNACTTDVCTAGVPSHVGVANGATCGGALTCLNGVCAGCGQPSDCPGADDECKARTCTVGVCGFSFTAIGTAVAAQTAGDCQKNQCDGAGSITGVADNTDAPADDGNQCTSDVCVAGVPTHPAVAANTACNQGGGSFCSAGGTCVQCNAGTQCAGTDTECHVRTCTANACGVSNTAAGTATSAQTAGDCQKNQCDGAGNIAGVADNTDLPADDGNQCTGEICTAGVPSHPAAAVDTACNQGGGSFCSAGGSCVQCNAATQCAGTDTECHTRTCSGNTCGSNNAPAGTATSAQTAGDCQKNQCDGAGNIVNAADNTDAPADDGNQCTSDVCVAGVPAHPAAPVDTACNQGGGSFCSAGGSCVQCNAGTQCAGTDTECHTRTCSGNTCGSNNAPAGTATSAQTVGDCQKNQCDGAGNNVNAADNTDLPADDGNQCTSEICTAGVPSHPAVPADTACNQGGGSFCSLVGTCVQCNAPAQCPGTDTECHTRSCLGNTCGSNDAPAGTATSAQTAGDCQKNQCDGAGNIASAADNTDVLDDGNQCTSDVCTAGVPSNPAVPAGTACNQAGGTACDGIGFCVGTPAVASTTPSDATTPNASPTIAVTFTLAMNPATLTGQTTAGVCSGSIQASLDDFGSCVAFSSASAVMSGGNTTATLTAAPGLLVSRIYKIRVTTAAASATGIALASTFTQATGFTTTSPNLCEGSVVMSQVYSGGGAAAATYMNDYVELHNRGTTAVNLAGTSLQYASTGGTSWSAALLTGTIPAGGYFLVKLGGGTGLTSLPAADATPSNALSMAAAAGKIAFVNSTTAIANGNACPPAATLIDFVGYGAATTCSEGSSPVGALSTTTAAFRNQNGCGDVNVNGTDFTVSAPVPRNSASAPAACTCAAENESNAALEADFCTVQSPLSLSVQTGVTTGNIYGQIYDLGTTEAGGANGNVRAQLGYGPPTANPEYEAGWTWINATYNVQSNNNDEYQASFLAPAAGSYRYVYRFSLDQGVTWTVCDKNAGDGGSGSNAALFFAFADEPVLTVTP
jgi:lamin tail-like protein